MGTAKTISAIALALAAPISCGSVDRTAAFETRILASHNREREAMGVPALVWDERLAAGAQAWADQLARTGRFEHQPVETLDKGKPGENLWAGTTGQYSPEEMVGLWIEEKMDFMPGVFPHISRSKNLQAVGHYSQLVWRGSARLGCGMASNGQDDLLVCRYVLAGNVIGESPI